MTDTEEATNEYERTLAALEAERLAAGPDHQPESLPSGSFDGGARQTATAFDPATCDDPGALVAWVQQMSKGHA